LALACSGLEPTQREIAEFLSLDPSQVVALIDDLERRGFVERTPGKQDRRLKIVTATTEGHGIHSKARAALHECEKAQFGLLSEAESNQLKSLLYKALWGSEANTNSLNFRADGTARNQGGRPTT